MGKKKVTKRRITARDAARAAAAYYQNVTGVTQRPTFEEVELNDEQRQWLVTLGVYPQNDPFGQQMYKRFEVDAYTGEVLSMKIRKV